MGRQSANHRAQPEGKTKTITFRISEAKKDTYIALLEEAGDNLTDHLTAAINAYIRKQEKKKLS